MDKNGKKHLSNCNYDCAIKELEGVGINTIILVSNDIN